MEVILYIVQVKLTFFSNFGESYFTGDGVDFVGVLGYFTGDGVDCVECTGLGVNFFGLGDSVCFCGEE